MVERLCDDEIVHQVCAVEEPSIYFIQASRPNWNCTEQWNVWHSMTDSAGEPTESHERRAGGGGLVKVRKGSGRTVFYGAQNKTAKSNTSRITQTRVFERISSTLHVFEWHSFSNSAITSSTIIIYIPLCNFYFPLFFLWRYVILTQSLFHFYFFLSGERPVGKHGATRGMGLLAKPHSHYPKCICMGFLLLRWSTRLRHKSVAFSVCALWCLTYYRAWQWSVRWFFSSFPLYRSLHVTKAIL